MSSGQLLTIDQAAAAAGVPAERLRELITTRRVPFYRLGRAIRLTAADLETLPPDEPPPAPRAAAPAPAPTKPARALVPRRPPHAPLDIDPDWRHRQRGETRAAYLRRYQRDRYHWLRREFFKDKRCIDCGSAENLELDHRDPNQKVSHRIWSWSPARRDAEIAKCDIRCQDCHKHRHQAKHGTRRRFDAGCRCDECVNAVRRRWREKAAAAKKARP